jgi:hypothetical protein
MISETHQFGEFEASEITAMPVHHASAAMASLLYHPRSTHYLDAIPPEVVFRLTVGHA